MRKTLALGIAAAMTTGLAALVPATASAACIASTGVGCVNTGTTALAATVGVSVTVLAIDVTPADTLTQSGSTLTTALPIAATVTDTNIPAVGQHGSWTVSVHASDLTLTGATGTIPAAGNATLTTSAPVVAAPGAATVTDLYNPAATGYLGPLALTGTDKALMTASTNNANIVTYNSTLSWTVPGSAPIGAYTGSVTQSVA